MMPTIFYIRRLLNRYGSAESELIIRIHTELDALFLQRLRQTLQKVMTWLLPSNMQRPIFQVLLQQCWTLEKAVDL